MPDAGVSGQPPGAAGREQTIRMENFFTPGSLPMGVTILDGQSFDLLAEPDNRLNVDPHWMQERSWLATTGFLAGVEESLPPSSLSGIYSVPVDMVLERIHPDPQRHFAEYRGGRGAVYAGAHVWQRIFT